MTGLRGAGCLTIALLLLDACDPAVIIEATWEDSQPASKVLVRAFTADCRRTCANTNGCSDPEPTEAFPNGLTSHIAVFSESARFDVLFTGYKEVVVSVNRTQLVPHELRLTLNRDGIVASHICDPPGGTDCGVAATTCP
jgi:hypothetical protein